MGRLSDIADRIKAKKLAHDAKADEWGRRLDSLELREPEAFAAGDAVVSERETDLASMEADLRQLSNFAPLPPSPGVSPGALEPSPPDPNAARRAAAGLAPLTDTDGTAAFVKRVQQP